MKRLLWLVLLSMPMTVAAEETCRIEVFGGYSFYRIPSRFSDHPSYAYTTNPAGLNGWDINVSASVNRWIGVEADFGGFRGQADALWFHSPTPAAFAQDFDIRTYLFGPRFSYRNAHIVTPFAHFLLGHAAINRMPVSNSPASSLAVAFGGGLDFKLARHLAIRAVQADYLRTRLSSHGEDNLRISTGVVARF